MELFTKSNSRVTECVFAAMTDAAAIDVMEALSSCRCCLRRPADKALKTPHTHEGLTEIYSDMIKECFNISLIEDSSLGICDVCVGSLREASAFKAQVQCSQEELKTRLEKALQAIDLEPMVKPEIPEDNEITDTFYPCKDEVSIKSEREDEPSEDHLVYPCNEEICIKSEGADEPSEDHLLFADLDQGGVSERTDASEEHCISRSPTAVSEGTTEPVSACTLELDWSVQLERLRSDEMLHTSQTYTARSHHQTSRACLVEDNAVQTSLAYAWEQANTSYFCGEQFTNKSSFITHIQKHPSQFTSKSALIAHSREKETYKCKKCNKELVYTSNFDRLKKTDNEVEPYTCKQCYVQFWDQNTIRERKRAHNSLKGYKCKHCSRQFTRICHLKVHIWRAHKEVKPYKCKECNEQFKTKRLLDIHYPNECSNVGDHVEFSPEENIITYGRVSKNDLSSGNVRNQQFSQTYSLDTHKILHNRDKSDLERRVMNYTKTHNKVKPYACTQCNRQFTRISGLKLHIWNIHNRVKPYKCKGCNEQFTSRLHLNIHYPNVCRHVGDQDQVEFSRKEKIITYEKVAKNHLFSCELCNQQFNQKDSLDTHKMVHNGEKSELERRIMTDSGAKSFDKV